MNLLFNEPLIAGLEYRDELVGEDEERQLLGRLTPLELPFRMSWSHERLSLKTPAVLRFRQRTPAGFRRASVEVAPRSAYLLSGESRWDWEHSIAAGEQLRFSITFRTLSAKGRGIAASQS